MLKFNSVLLLVILCNGFHLSCCENLKCEFEDVDYLVVGFLYTCKVTTLDNPFDNVTIDGYTGVHMDSKNDKDVKEIFIAGAKTKYIPVNLGSLFNLFRLLIDNSELVEIRSKDFYGMQNLEYLSLSYNKLTSVPSDTFSMLLKLKVICLDYNQIKYIGSGAFDQLTNLNRVYLYGNICVNNPYNGTTAITQMKEDLKVNCHNPNDPHEIIIKLKEEKKQLIMDKDALKKEKDALMINHDALKVQNDALIKDKDVLQKMLNNQQTECETKTQELMSKLSHLIQPTEEELICDFNDETYNILGLLYSCDVTSLDNTCNNKVIKGQNGVHKGNKNAKNVKAIYIYSTNATHIPEGLGSLFNLTAFQMFNTQLKEIRIKDFENMENLEYFNFDYNKLTSVPLEVLKMLNKLKYISLQSNLISELTPGLFDHNLELVEVYLDRNRIQVIGSGFFNRLTKLTIVHMTGNKCVDKIYEGSTEMVQMRKDVELNCKVQQ